MGQDHETGLVSRINEERRRTGRVGSFRWDRSMPPAALKRRLEGHAQSTYGIFIPLVMENAPGSDYYLQNPTGLVDSPEDLGRQLARNLWDDGYHELQDIVTSVPAYMHEARLFSTGHVVRYAGLTDNEASRLFEGYRQECHGLDGRIEERDRVQQVWRAAGERIMQSVRSQR